VVSALPPVDTRPPHHSHRYRARTADTARGAKASDAATVRVAVLMFPRLPISPSLQPTPPRSTSS